MTRRCIVIVKKFNSEKLNEITNELLEAIDKSTKKILSFHNSALEDVVDINAKLKECNLSIENIRKAISVQDKEFRVNRNKLLDISRNKSTAEDEILYKHIYEKAEASMFLQRDLENQDKEAFQRRDSLGRRLIIAKRKLRETDELIKTIEILNKYLSTNLADIGLEFDKKEEILLKIIEAGEEEKSRLAREIHDGPTQTLTHLNVEIQLIKQLIKEKDLDGALKETEEMEMHLANAIQETREIIYNLRPMSIDDLGIIPTLINYIKRFEARTSLKCTLEIRDNDNLSNRIPEVLELILFRLVQETTNNIYKHAKASNISIDLKITKNNITLNLIDDGEGFNVEKVLQDIETDERYGLIGMKERIKLIEGNIKIKSEIGKGSDIFIEIPLNLVDR